MTDNEQDQPAAKRNPRDRHRLVLIGAGGAAVILAGGAFLVTRHDDQRQSLRESPAMAPLATSPMVPAGSAPDSRSTEAPLASEPAPTKTQAGGQDAERETSRGSAQGAETPEKVRKEVQRARAQAAADGIPLKRPLKQKTLTSAIEERTEKIKNGTVRVMSAKEDLTGQRALSYAGDQGKPVGGGISCTNKIRFSKGVPATERPSVLLCWRTSSERSVVTMAVTPKDKPSTATSIDLIKREWARLG